MEIKDDQKIKHPNKIAKSGKFTESDKTLANKISVNFGSALTEAEKKIVSSVLDGSKKNKNDKIAKFMNKYIEVPEVGSVSVSSRLVAEVGRKLEDKSKEGDPLALKVMSGGEKVKKIIAMLPAEKSSEFIAELQKYLTGELSEEEKKKFIKVYDKYSTLLSTQEYKDRLQRHELEGQYLRRLRDQIVMKTRK